MLQPERSRDCLVQRRASLSGHSVLQASSDLIKDTALDLVVTHYQMPPMNGVELCREFSRRYSDSVVVGHSPALQRHRRRSEAKRCAALFITKPIKGEALDLVARLARSSNTTRFSTRSGAPDDP